MCAPHGSRSSRVDGIRGVKCVAVLPELGGMEVSASSSPRDPHPENRPWGGMRMLYVHMDAA